MRFEVDDGGRRAAGFHGERASDCVARSVAIASGRPYEEIYHALTRGCMTERKSKGRSANYGVRVERVWFKRYMETLGFVWTPTMGIGTGCRVHLVDGEVPETGRHVLSLSRHYTALVNGVIRDTYDPCRSGGVLTYPLDSWGWNEAVRRAYDRYGKLRPGWTRNALGLHHTSGPRCVYGIWTLKEA